MQIARSPRATTPWTWFANAIAVALLVYWWLWLVGSSENLPPVTDARSYWSLDMPESFDSALTGANAFRYSPLVGQLLMPFTVLPFVVFYAVLSAASLAALAWMTGPILAVVAILAFPPVSREIGNGNIHLLLAAGIVL